MINIDSKSYLIYLLTLRRDKYKMSKTKGYC